MNSMTIDRIELVDSFQPPIQNLGGGVATPPLFGAPECMASVGLV